MIALVLGYKDSNLEMTESESVALPFGDTPLSVCFAHKTLLYTFRNKNQVLFLKYLKKFKIFMKEGQDMFEMQRKITYSQVRRNLKLDMAEIAQFFQDCVLCQSEIIGKGVAETERSQTAWFLSSWQIEVERYPEFMEEVTVRTWPHEFKSMYGYRNFDIIDGKGVTIAKANSIWIFMDLAKMRPSKPREENVIGYQLEPALEMEYDPRKINILSEEYKISDLVEPIEVKYSFLDSNDHVNNGRYVKEAMDYLPTDRELKKMRVDYRKAATLGDKMYPVKYQKEDLIQLVFADGEGNPYVIVEVS